MKNHYEIIENIGEELLTLSETAAITSLLQNTQIIFPMMTKEECFIINNHVRNVNVRNAQKVRLMLATVCSDIFIDDDKVTRRCKQRKCPKIFYINTKNSSWCQEPGASVSVSETSELLFGKWISYCWRLKLPLPSFILIHQPSFKVHTLQSLIQRVFWQKWRKWSQGPSRRVS